MNGLDPERVYTTTARPQLLRTASFGNLLRFLAPAAAGVPDRMPDGGFAAECSGAALESGIPLGKRYSGSGYNDSLRMQGDFASNVFCVKPKG